MTERAGTETGRSGRHRQGQRLAGHGQRHHPAALEGQDLEARGSLAERDVARRQRLLAGQQVAGLDEDRLVLHLHERDLAVLVGEDHRPVPVMITRAGWPPGRLSLTQKVRLPP